MYRYFKKIIGVGKGDYIHFWESEGLSDENVTPLITSNHSLTPQPSYLGTKTRVKSNGSCLKQDKITYSRETNNSKHVHCLWIKYKS